MFGDVEAIAADPDGFGHGERNYFFVAAIDRESRVLDPKETERIGALGKGLFRFEDSYFGAVRTSGIGFLDVRVDFRRAARAYGGS